MMSRSRELRAKFPAAILAGILGVVPLLAEDTANGVALPFTVTGGVLVSDRAKAADPAAARAVAGFRTVLYPGLKINSNWSVRSAVQIYSEPFFYYEAFYPEMKLEAQVQQLFVGYTRKGEESAIAFKVGKLPSAFGAFPLRYSDSVNPLLDQPFGYAYAARLRPDQLPCGVGDLEHQKVYPVYVEHYCGGAPDEGTGMVPVTLYGLPGAEINVSWHRFDGRFQLTNSSPANPQDPGSDSQYAQWTAGGGYTIRQGFRIGASAFSGPFLEESVYSLLPSGTDPRDYPATGIGADLQWGRGRWSANAEWQRVEFNYPRFSRPPAISSGYLEVKTTLSPRFYAAVRSGYETWGRVEDTSGVQSNHVNPDRQSHELALGYHLNHFQTLKLGYEWMKTNGLQGTRDNIFGIQFVTSVHSLSRSF